MIYMSIIHPTCMATVQIVEGVCAGFSIDRIYNRGNYMQNRSIT